MQKRVWDHIVYLLLDILRLVCKTEIHPYLPSRKDAAVIACFLQDRGIFNIWDSRFVNVYEWLTRCIHSHEYDCHNSEW